MGATQVTHEVVPCLIQDFIINLFPEQCVPCCMRGSTKIKAALIVKIHLPLAVTGLLTPVNCCMSRRYQSWARSLHRKRPALLLQGVVFFSPLFGWLPRCCCNSCEGVLTVFESVIPSQLLALTPETNGFLFNVENVCEFCLCCCYSGLFRRFLRDWPCII